MTAEIVARFEPEQPEEAPIVVPQVAIVGALSALATLTLYKEQQGDSNAGVLRMLEVYRRIVEGRQLRAIDRSLSYNTYNLAENFVIRSICL